MNVLLQIAQGAMTSTNEISDAEIDKQLSELNMNSTFKTCSSRTTKKNAVKILHAALADGEKAAEEADTAEDTTLDTVVANGNSDAFGDKEQYGDGEVCMGDNDVECVDQINREEAAEAEADNEREEKDVKAREKKTRRKLKKRSDSLKQKEKCEEIDDDADTYNSNDDINDVVVVMEDEKSVYERELREANEARDIDTPTSPVNKKRAVARDKDTDIPTPHAISAEQYLDKMNNGCDNDDDEYDTEERDEILDEQNDLLASTKTDASQKTRRGHLEKFVAVTLLDNYNGQKSHRNNTYSLYGSLAEIAANGKQDTMSEKKILLSWSQRAVLDSVLFIDGTMEAALASASNCDPKYYSNCIDMMLNVTKIKTNYAATNDLSAEEKIAQKKCYVLGCNMKLNDTRELILSGIADDGTEITRQIYVCADIVPLIYAIHTLREFPLYLCEKANTRREKLRRKIRDGETTYQDAILALLEDHAKKNNLMDFAQQKLGNALQSVYQSGIRFNKARAAANRYTDMCTRAEEQRLAASQPMVEDTDEEVSDDSIIN